MFSGDQALFAWLRPSKIDGARGAWAVLRCLTRSLRTAWPEVRLVLRADSGFCRWRMLRWCEANQVDYIVGLAKNKRLNEMIKPFAQQAEELWEESAEKQRVFGWLDYGALKWAHSRNVIAKAELGPQGPNPRYVVTNLGGGAQELYEKVYCTRGDMENRIKEQQLGLFADRTSCHRWWPNQLRLMLSTLAYTLIEGLRRIALKGTNWSRKQASTWRCALLKVGAVVLRITRRIVVRLSSSDPHRAAFMSAHAKLRARG